MPCLAHARRRSRRAYEDMDPAPAIQSTDLLGPDAGQHEGWAVEAVLYPGTDGIPAAILGILSEYSLALDPAGTARQGGYLTLRAIA